MPMKIEMIQLIKMKYFIQSHENYNNKQNIIF